MRDQNILKNKLRNRRIARVRSKIKGTSSCPRIVVFRSLKHLSVQAIDDGVGQTIVAAADREIKAKDKKLVGREIGQLLAHKLLAKNIKRAVFDKRFYRYHGKIKEIATGVREGGIKV